MGGSKGLERGTATSMLFWMGINEGPSELVAGNCQFQQKIPDSLSNFESELHRCLINVIGFSEVQEGIQYCSPSILDPVLDKV